MTPLRLAAVAVAASAVLSAATGATLSSAATAATPEEIVAAALAANQESHARDGDDVMDTSGAVRVRLTGATASVSGPGASVSGSTVTVTSPGTYVVQGTGRGRLVVASPGDGKVRLVLAGASVTSPAGPAIEIQEADEALVLLAPSTANRLVAGPYATATDAPAAALHSRADLTIGGTGRLAVRGGAKDGIATSDGLAILGGRITVDAGDEGVRGKDYVIVEGGSLTVRAKGDGVRSDSTEDPTRGYVAVLGGTVDVTAADGLAGATDVIVGGGTIRARTVRGLAFGTSAKALKAGKQIVIGGGAITVVATDDAVHSDGSVTIAEGTLVLATDDDGVHAERRLTITGGSVTVRRSREGLEATTMVIGGGTVRIRAEDDGIGLATGAGPAQGRGGALRNAATPNHLTVSGGVIVVDAGSDGIDANGSITITGGTVVVTGPTQGFNGAIDADAGIEFQGGLVMAAGSMSATPGTGSSQGWLSATLPEQVPAGSVLHLVQDGEVLASYRARVGLGALVFSSPDLAASGPVDVYVGGSLAGTGTAGLVRGGSIAGARRLTTVTTGEYSPPRGPGPGGGPGGPPPPGP